MRPKERGGRPASLWILNGEDLLTEGADGWRRQDSGFFTLAGTEGIQKGQLSLWTCEDMTTGHLTRDVQQAGRTMGVELEREDLEGIFFL